MTRKRIKAWFGVDLDATLAHYETFGGAGEIGAPIQRMVRRIKYYLRKGRTVKIVTARICGLKSDDPVEAKEALDALQAINKFTADNLGQVLEVTNEKDYGMIELLDDRVAQVIPNTGKLVTHELKIAIRALRAIEVSPQHASLRASEALSELDPWSLKLAKTN